MRTPEGHLPSIGTGIVLPARLVVNQCRLPGQVSDTKEEAPPFAHGSEFALPMQTPEMVRAEVRDSRCLGQRYEFFVSRLQSCAQLRSTVLKPIGQRDLPVSPKQRGMITPLLHQCFHSHVSPVRRC